LGKLSGENNPQPDNLLCGYNSGLKPGKGMRYESKGALARAVPAKCGEWQDPDTTSLAGSILG